MERERLAVTRNSVAWTRGTITVLREVHNGMAWQARQNLNPLMAQGFSEGGAQEPRVTDSVGDSIRAEASLVAHL